LYKTRVDKGGYCIKADNAIHKFHANKINQPYFPKVLHKARINLLRFTSLATAKSQNFETRHFREKHII